MDKWKVHPYDDSDKRITITGPHEVVMYLDYDDVNPYLMDQMAVEIVARLNKEDWDDAVVYPEYFDCGCVEFKGKLVEDCAEYTSGEDCCRP